MTSLFKFRENINNPFIALRHANFRYYWAGMCVSLIGTWMQNIAQPWLAYTLTKSPFLLSLVSAAQFTPVLIFSLFAGVVIDKLPKKNILYFTQASSMIITLVLAILVQTGYIQYWHILMLATLLGVVNTLDMPSRQAFVVEMVGREDLMNAIALNSSVFNIARIIGPALAGLLMGYAGVAFCFFANSASFAAVIIGLFFIKPVTAVKRLEPKKGQVLVDIKDGLKYIFQHKILLDTLLSTAIVATFALNFSVLVPVFAREVLGKGEVGFGMLMSLMGIGSFIGAMTIAAMSRSGPHRFILNVLPVIISVFLIITGFTGQFAITGLMLAAAGFCFVAFSSTANSSMQLNTADEYRGRVMSVYTLVFSGSSPFGNLYAGYITDHLGARAGFIACGAITLALFALISLMRHKTSPKPSKLA